MKVIFFFLILSLLNSTSAVASTECCLGCNLNLFALLAYPSTIMRTVWSGDMFIGKGGSIYEKSVINPVGPSKFYRHYRTTLWAVIMYE